MFTTVDGYIAGAHGELDWFVGTISDEELDASTKAMLANCGTIVVGARVYESLVRYWPTDASKDDLYAAEMNAIPKLVFSTSYTEVQWGAWNNARLAKGGVAQEVAALRAEFDKHDKDIVVFGGPTLIYAFREADLIDEYRMQVCPTVIGSGTPFFKNVAEPLKLRLVSATPHPSGVLELRYRPTRSLAPGSTSSRPAS
jgi:dihydrofolate reductase